MDKTVKMRSFDGKVEAPPPENQEDKAKSAAALGIKNPQAELLKKIEVLESQLEQERAKMASMSEAFKKISNMALAAAKIKDGQ